MRAVLAGLVAGLVLSAVVVGWAIARAPNPSNFAAVVAEREPATRARPVALSRIAPFLREAVVATEDERFWRHHGVDVEGLLRAAAFDATHLTTAQGASTITEQLSKDLYLGGNDHSPWRKLEDAVTAFRLETLASKDAILAAYMNTVYLGDGNFGVARASERYFGAPPSRLSLPQASLLAGLIQAPSTYDPFNDPSAARVRQAVVLTSMIRTHDVTAQEADAALSAPLRLANGRTLPAVGPVDLSVGPAFSMGELVAGVATMVAAGLAIVLVRRRRRRGRVRSARSRVAPAMAWRAATIGAMAIGFVIAVRSFRVG